jgi:hypothetical protein
VEVFISNTHVYREGFVVTDRKGVNVENICFYLFLKVLLSCFVDSILDPI